MAELSNHDLYLFNEGSLFESYRMLGAHLGQNSRGVDGVRFTVWAPLARQIYVQGDFNGWDGQQHPLNQVGTSGIWSIFVEHAHVHQCYKYEIHTSHGNIQFKADPYAFFSEVRPSTASVICDLSGFSWQDDKWQQDKQGSLPYERPMNIYEVHLGSWKQTVSDDHNEDVYNKYEEFYSYRALAEELVQYAAQAGYTHIELLPVVEHPFDGSWGYQGTGYYSVTSRYGHPHDFMYFVDQCHQHGLGVILDWVPGHFAKDEHGLRLFDGTPQYEYEDERLANNSIWGTSHFDLGKPQVQSFLVSNALFWMDMYHIDGLRVDAVAYMLLLNHGRHDREQVFNRDGGEENLEAIKFLRRLNTEVFQRYPQALMIAEDSSAWPHVTAPVDKGGLGFNYKWNMGWMNDVLTYMALEPENRKDHHDLLTFSFDYTFSENYILPLSHDEVVHLKKSLISKMPGDYWQKFAQLRLLFAFMCIHPGKKLLFMGGEFAQFDEWSELKQLDWHLFEYDMHRQFHEYTKSLNHFYLAQSSLWELDHDPHGVQWVDADNHEQSILILMRKSRDEQPLLIVLNFTPVFYPEFTIGVSDTGSYKERFNSDHEHYGGSGQINTGRLESYNKQMHGFPNHITVKVPPYAVSIFQKV